MIITRTPLRISFAGGGSDFESYYLLHEGCVVSTSIDKYMYIILHPAFQRHEIIFKHDIVETVNDACFLKHPIAREVFKETKIIGVEMNSISDIPYGTGLGTSSAFTVGALHALYTYNGIAKTQEELAFEACEIEINKLNSPIGRQDQFGCSLGGLNIIRFCRDGKINSRRINIGEDVKIQLQNNLLLFYLGGSRQAKDVLKHQKKDTILLKRLAELAENLAESLEMGDVSTFGKILNENWIIKKQLGSNVSSDRIDYFYNKALKNGAIGGKLLGAGKTGFLLLYCEENRQKQLREALVDLQELPFKFEQDGTKLVDFKYLV